MIFRYHVQYLRALAATLVVIYHVALHWAVDRQAAYNLLNCGVDIFFVISGLVMWMITEGGRETPGGFLGKRLRRIVPAYWLITTVMVGGSLFAARAMLSSKFDLGHVVGSYVFFPVLHPVKHMWEPVVFAGWTLNYEMMFYALFALALFLPRRFQLAALLASLAGLVLLGAVPHRPDNVLSFYSDPIVLEFGLGLILGWAVTRGVNPPARLSGLMIGAGLALLAAGNWIPLSAGLAKAWGVAAGTPLADVDLFIPANPLRALIWGVPAALMVAGFVLLEGKRADNRPIPVLRFLGDASYSTYLTHAIVISVAFQVATRLHMGAGAPLGLVGAVVALAASLVVGSMFYRFVEQPMLRGLRTVLNLLGPKQRTATAGAPPTAVGAAG